MIDVLFVGVGVLALAIGIWRAIRARRTGSGAGIAIALLALGSAFCFLSNRAQMIESQIYPSLGRLLSNLATMVAAYGIGLTVAEISGTRDRGRRTRLVALGAALAILIVMFFSTSGLPRGIGVFNELYRSHPTLVVYVLAYSLYLGFAVVDIAVMSAVTMRASGGALRAGLVLLLIASVLAVAYLVGKIVATIQDVVAEQPVQGVCAGAFSTLRCTLDVGFPALSVLLIVLGLTIPAVPGMVRALRDGRTMRVLRPMRAHLTERFPETVRLDEPGRTRRERLLTAMSETNDGLILAGVPPSMAAAAAARRVQDGDGAPGGPEDDEPAPAVASGEPAFTADITRLRAIGRSYRQLSRTAR